MKRILNTNERMVSNVSSYEIERINKAIVNKASK